MNASARPRYRFNERIADAHADVRLVGKEAVHTLCKERRDLTREVARSGVTAGPLELFAAESKFSARNVQPCTIRPAACASAIKVVGVPTTASREAGSIRFLFTPMPSA